MTPPALLSAAITLLQTRSDLNTFEALMISRDDPSDAATLIAAMQLVLAGANVLTGNLNGPALATAVIAWDRAQRVASIVTPLQATASAAIAAIPIQAAPVTAGS